MRQLTVESIKTKDFHLKENDTLIATLTYPGWFSFSADIQFSDGSTYRSAPKGVWGTTIQLKKEDQVLLSFKMHWNGSIIIESWLDGVQKDFVFKAKGIFKSAYILGDKDDPELMVLQPQFKWNKFNYNYVVKTDDLYKDQALTNLMVLIAVHCANYYLTMMTVIT